MPIEPMERSGCFAVDNVGVSKRLGLALLMTLAAVVLCVAVQAVAGVWFPPPISLSQYGIGPQGWIFSLWVLTLAAAPIISQSLVPQRTRWGARFLLVGAVGTAVMAVVRTDVGGEQGSVNAKIHMVGSILALFFIPLGVAVVLWACGRVWRWVGLIMLTAIAASLVLLLLAAAGLDTTGRGPQLSWVWWQTVAAVLDHLIVLVLGLAAWQVFSRSRGLRPATGSLNVH